MNSRLIALLYQIRNFHSLRVCQPRTSPWRSRAEPTLFLNGARFRSSTVLIMKRKRTKAGQISPTLVCAWCQNIMKPGAPKISHGICRACTGRFFGKFRPALPIAQ
jgi:hypothetical protein